MHNSTRPWEDSDYSLAEVMSSYWANFVKNGDPNGEGLANWPAYDTRTDMQMELGTNIGAKTIGDKDRIALITRYLTEGFNLQKPFISN
jgi:carboxylesterase type B